MLEGEHKKWWDNGQILLHEFYRDGKLEGERKKWCDNGQLWFHEFYHHGKLEGECKYWHENGRLWVSDFYRNGNLEGEVKIWSCDSRLQFHRFYRDHSMVYDLNLKMVMRLLRLKDNLRNRVRKRWQTRIEQKLIRPLAIEVTRFLI